MISFKWLAIATIISLQISGSWKMYRKLALGSDRPVLYGAWDVESYQREGISFPEMDRPSHWKRLLVDSQQFLNARLVDDKSIFLRSKYDTAKKQLFLQAPSISVSYSYDTPDRDHLVLKSQEAGPRTTIRLKRIDESKFLLTHRGFDWINECPYNR